MKTNCTALLVTLALTTSVRAELIDLQILHREPYADGKSFGDVGPYEKITGIAKFAIDPKHPKNKIIVDLDLAPRNKDGRVEFESDLYILAPKDLSKGNGAIFYDVNNRGNKLALKMFNTPDDNPFLMRRGYTVVWSGWIGELLPGDERLLLKPPVAMENGKPVRGIVRFETSADKPAKSLPLSRREGHGSYRPTPEGLANATLTKRTREADPRVVIPQRLWQVKVQPMIEVKEGVPGTLPQVRLELTEGFEPGVLYELICECEGSIVQGTGFAAVRDLISCLRYDHSAKNPFQRHDKKPAYDRALAFGVSQSGRFLRHLLWQGFNEDEKDRIVFDGLMPHVAGGGLGFFNHRFAQPTRFNGQHEDHCYPTDMAPLQYGLSFTPPDPDAIPPAKSMADGILLAYEKSAKKPKIMHTQSAAEYWHRSGSVVHASPDQDTEIPPSVRIYAFGGTQHGPAADPKKPGIGQNLANPADYRPFLRALLDALDDWVRIGVDPPLSVYPRFSNGTLVDWRNIAFPKLPGGVAPEVIQEPAIAHFGPEFRTRGIITVEPPRKLGAYQVWVPKSGQDGNDLGTLNLPDIAVPLATYTGWNLRKKEVGAEGELASLLGSYIPFARTKAEREKTGDPRVSIEECYGSFDNYQNRYAEACERLVKGRYLLAEDAKRLIESRAKVKELFP
jgi:Alpha/beta hydrolase domain